jgi:hypothetical protein
MSKKNKMLMQMLQIGIKMVLFNIFIFLKQISKYKFQKFGI